MMGELKSIRELLEQVAGRFVRRSRRTALAETAQGMYDPADPMPMEIPLGMELPESLDLKIQRLVAHGLAGYARDNAKGTFQEEDDFSEDDPELLPVSAFQLTDFQMEEEGDQPDASPPPREFSKEGARTPEELAALKAETQPPDPPAAEPPKTEAPT